MKRRLVLLMVVLVVAWGTALLFHARPRPTATVEPVERAASSPVASPPALRRPPPLFRTSPRRAISWSSPGLCADGTDSRARAEARLALLRTFKREEIGDLTIARDPAVPPAVLQTIAFAIGRTRQFANHLLGWSPQQFPPPIHVYASAEQLRSVACVGGLAYYDGSIHLSGDPRFTATTIQQQAVHEYVHHVLAAMGVSRPAWLHEGLAMQIAEETWFREPGLGLVEALVRQPLPFESLVDGIPHALRDEREADLAYYQSYLMVGLLRQQLGAAGLRELLDQLAWERLPPERAFDRVGAESVGELWRRYLLSQRGG